MTTSIITASYNNAITVSFTNDAWFNATEVAKQYDKRPNDWLSLESTKEYIMALHTALFPEIQLPEKMVIKQNQLLKTKTGSQENGGGAWFHPDLAVAFARWLNVKFSIWCDMQIKKILQGKPVQRDFVNEPEPLRICYATVEQREIVVKAVRKFTIVAQSKGRNISFEEAHDMVNLRLGIRHINKMTVEQIPDALQAVGQMLERVIFEGEFIAKGEAEPAAKVDVAPIVEKISDKQYQAIRDSIYQIASCCKQEGGAKWAIEDAIARQYSARPKDLAVKDYDAVVGQLKVLNEMAKQHFDLIVQADVNFIKCVLREGRFNLPKEHYGLLA
jgi:predicted nucleic acid-binding protein